MIITDTVNTKNSSFQKRNMGDLENSCFKGFNSCIATTTNTIENIVQLLQLCLMNLVYSEIIHVLCT